MEHLRTPEVSRLREAGHMRGKERVPSATDLRRINLGKICICITSDAQLFFHFHLIIIRMRFVWFEETFGLKEWHHNTQKTKFKYFIQTNSLEDQLYRPSPMDLRRQEING